MELWISWSPFASPKYDPCPTGLRPNACLAIEMDLPRVNFHAMAPCFALQLGRALSTVKYSDLRIRSSKFHVQRDIRPVKVRVKLRHTRATACLHHAHNMLPYNTHRAINSK
jgi:hypothetical protein